MHGRLLASIGLLSLAAVTLGDEPAKQAPTPVSLAKVVTEWQQTLVADIVTTRLATLDAMSPDARDAAVLFPKYADKLGRLFELIKQQQADGLASAPPEALVAERAKQQQIRRVRTFDVRNDKDSKSYAPVLKLLPLHVSVYRVEIEYDKEYVKSGSYVFVNDRWVYIRDLKAMPELLPKLDSLLQQMQAKPLK
jgi:hypothetical protein